MTTAKYPAASSTYMEQASAEFDAGDIRQAAEKGWGAANQAAKALAESRGKPHRQHLDLDGFVLDFCDEVHIPDLHRQWNRAQRLHTHFYEGDLDPQTVGQHINDVRHFCATITDYVL